MDPSAQPSPEELKALITTGFSHLLANKYYVLASTVMLLYDHILTFEQERLFIWKQKKSLPTYLFFVFRYITPIVSSINLIALNDPNWKGSTCSNWIWLPVAVGPIISAATGIILIMRVHAIYSRATWVLYILIPVYGAQLAIMGWSIPAGAPAPLPPGFIGCVPSEKPGTGRRLSALYIAALAFDATIFALTFARALYTRLSRTTVPLMELIIRDGTLYFLVIFVVNLVNVFLLQLAPPDLSAINAPFASMITAIMVARLVLNLRAAARRSRTALSSTLHGTASTGIGEWKQIAPRNRGALGIGTMTFHEMIGYNEFDVPLTSMIFDAETYKKGPEEMELHGI